jgi:hypothetical protein
VTVRVHVPAIVPALTVTVEPDRVAVATEALVVLTVVLYGVVPEEIVEVWFALPGSTNVSVLGVATGTETAEIVTAIVHVSLSASVTVTVAEPAATAWTVTVEPEIVAVATPVADDATLYAERPPDTVAV